MLNKDRRTNVFSEVALCRKPKRNCSYWPVTSFILAMTTHMFLVFLDVTRIASRVTMLSKTKTNISQQPLNGNDPLSTETVANLTSITYQIPNLPRIRSAYARNLQPTLKHVVACWLSCRYSRRYEKEERRLSRL